MKPSESPSKPRSPVRFVATLIALLALSFPAVAGTTNTTQEPENPLLEALRLTLQARNPAIKHVAILDLQAFFFDTAEYVLVGWGINGDRSFHGDFRDELFGVFFADSKLTTITETLDIFPTPRWYDYGLSIEGCTGDSVVVVGRGLTYGDHRERRAYARHPRVHRAELDLGDK